MVVTLSMVFVILDVFMAERDTDVKKSKNFPLNRIEYLQCFVCISSLTVIPNRFYINGENVLICEQTEI